MAKFELTPKQAFAWFKLMDKTSKEIGYGGAAGGGKSILGCFWVLTMAQKYPGTKWLIGRKELTNLKKTTLLSFFQVIQILGKRPDDLFVMNSQTNIIQFHNGSMIFLMDMSHQPSDPLYTRFGGLELTGAFVDESNENDIMALEILKTRLGRGLNKKYGIIPKLLETFNPSKNHVYHRYYKPWKDEKLPEHRVFITALATDNPYLDENYIEQLRNADRTTRERLLHGNFEYDDDPSKLFEYDKIIDLFTNDIIIPSRHQIYISCDVARFGEDKTVAMVWKDWMVDKVVSLPKSSMKQVVEMLENLAQVYHIPRSNIVIDEDGVGGGVVDFMPGVKGFVNNSTPIESKFGKKIHNYRNLKTQCYFKLAEKANKGEIGICEVSPECQELIIADLEQIAQKNIDKDGKIEILGKDEIKEKLGRSTDYSDALMMRCYFELKGSYKPYMAT